MGISDFMFISGYTQKNHPAHQLQRNLQQAARRLQPAGGLLMVSKISSPEFSRVTKRSIQGF
jgi:hypothetical protein